MSHADIWGKNVLGREKVCSARSLVWLEWSERREKLKGDRSEGLGSGGGGQIMIT